MHEHKQSEKRKHRQSEKKEELRKQKTAENCRKEKGKLFGWAQNWRAFSCFRSRHKKIQMKRMTIELCLSFYIGD
jgi:hypothetical protein